MNKTQVQHAIAFLAVLHHAQTAGSLADTLPEKVDEESLVGLAQSLGYMLDFESIAEAFRLRMFAREVSRRRDATTPVQSPRNALQ